MEIIDKSHKPDYALGYYVVLAFSFLTLRKVNKIEKWKLKLKEKKKLTPIKTYSHNWARFWHKNRAHSCFIGPYYFI
ncbi:hypothetical protein GCM10007063_33290 [Lentibacillus kapialis]|uniref:Uncharacterized protein n=1 Tax=Lentibacillus kapialis TaxID=340214 RepID=A0A917Q2K8_9BACI|nr:hypothetical protein GCM10007063_33290 [Lentibacillus kapialis]